MVYRVIGIMSGSSLDGLDIAYVELQETTGNWSYELKASACYPFTDELVDKLRTAHQLSAIDYHLLHTEFGHYIAGETNRFIQENQLEYKVQLIASHGHTTFHIPSKRTTGQIGDGAAIAAGTGINVVSDLRAMDVALGGEGAPIVPVGEKMLFSDYQLFLNIGGIANISFNANGKYLAFDVCAANRVLNLLSKQEDQEFDKDGVLSSQGNLNNSTLNTLNELEYYHGGYPKSLANSFGTDVVYPLIRGTGNTRDVMRTYVEHIAQQTAEAVKKLLQEVEAGNMPRKMLVTGGGAHNSFLVQRITEALQPLNVELVVPSKQIIEFKEAIVMALIGILRWREEYNVFSSVTGASRNSIGGAVWIGQEA